MKLNKMYQYAFYIFYRFSEKAPSRWMSEWKAGLVLLVLEIWLWVSFICYYSVLTKTTRIYRIHDPLVFIPLTFLVVINYYIFYRNDRWKAQVREFNQLPKKTNRIGSIAVWLVAITVIANLVFSFYLMSRVDWSLYR